MGLRRVESHPEVLQHAIHDGINVFIRDVLIPQGFIKADRQDEINGLALSKVIDQIAKEVAGLWVQCEIDETQ